MVRWQIEKDEVWNEWDIYECGETGVERHLGSFETHAAAVAHLSVKFGEVD